MSLKHDAGGFLVGYRTGSVTLRGVLADNRRCQRLGRPPLCTQPPHHRHALRAFSGPAPAHFDLGGIPRTVEVLPDNAETFRSGRKLWFFKPAAGYGSKAACRGDKLTERIFAEISRGGHCPLSPK